jgi:hypothetical protein
MLRAIRISLSIAVGKLAPQGAGSEDPQAALERRPTGVAWPAGHAGGRERVGNQSLAFVGALEAVTDGDVLLEMAP